MADECCIFVDGENFRFSIIDLFPEFKKQDQLPRKADWEGFFDWLVSELPFEHACRRLRTYWYVPEVMYFYPNVKQDLRHPKYGQYNLDRMVNKLANSRFGERLKGHEGEALITEVEKIVGELRDFQTWEKSRFEEWNRLYNNIAESHRAIEFRRSGALPCDLLSKTIRSEKGVDVKLATDMLLLKDIYDVAIIVSGDQDYVAAVEAVKDAGKRVANVSFKTRRGKVLPGGAQRLNQITDDKIVVEHDKLVPHLGIELALFKTEKESSGQAQEENLEVIDQQEAVTEAEAAAGEETTD